MYYLFPKAVKLSICDDIVRSCLRNKLETASVVDYSKNKVNEFFEATHNRNDESVRKTDLYFIHDIFHFLYFTFYSRHCMCDNNN